MVKHIGNKTFVIGQRKTDSTIKVAYEVLKDQKNKLVFVGSFPELQKWYEHQIKLANKREERKMIADMCGTSYAAACRDMGMGL